VVEALPVVDFIVTPTPARVVPSRNEEPNVVCRPGSFSRIHQLIEAILHVFARKNVPALVVLPANDLADAPAAFTQQLEYEIARHRRPFQIGCNSVVGLFSEEREN